MRDFVPAGQEPRHVAFYRDPSQYEFVRWVTRSGRWSKPHIVSGGSSIETRCGRVVGSVGKRGPEVIWPDRLCALCLERL